jgi:hypothetical protein
MQLSLAQMEPWDQALALQADQRILAWLKQRYPGLSEQSSDQTLLGFISEQRNKAQSFGIVLEPDFAVFLDWLAMYGTDLLAQPWANLILNSALSASDKVAAIQARLYPSAGLNLAACIMAEQEFRRRAQLSAFRPLSMQEDDRALAKAWLELYRIAEASLQLTIKPRVSPQSQIAWPSLALAAVTVRHQFIPHQNKMEWLIHQLQQLALLPKQWPAGALAVAVISKLSAVWAMPNLPHAVIAESVANGMVAIKNVSGDAQCKQGILDLLDFYRQTDGDFNRLLQDYEMPSEAMLSCLAKIGEQNLFEVLGVVAPS